MLGLLALRQKLCRAQDESMNPAINNETGSKTMDTTTWDYVQIMARAQLAELGRTCVSVLVVAGEPGESRRGAQGTWIVEGVNDDRVVRVDGVEVHGPNATQDDKVFARIAASMIQPGTALSDACSLRRNHVMVAAESNVGPVRRRRRPQLGCVQDLA